MLEQERREFQVEIDEPPDPVVLCEVLGAAIDEDTMSRIEDAGKIAIRDNEAVKLYVEQRHTKLTSRAAGKAIPKDSDKIVYGVGDAQVPGPLPVSAVCGGGCGGCAIHPADTDPWRCPPCAPESQEGQCHLDSFGKGQRQAEGREAPNGMFQLPRPWAPSARVHLSLWSW